MNISNISNCYGCGVCTKACSKKIINLHINEDGFYKPVISDIDNCVDCGLCADVCAYINELSFPNKPVKSFAAWSNNEQIRLSSTSGGVSIELARHYLSQGYKFCGVRYNKNNNRVEHYIAETPEEITQSTGSKYLQSYTPIALDQINKSDKYLVVGTPCQIASFRRYIRKFKCEKNFILVDFFCHGVPSKLLWDKYFNEHKVGLGDIQSASWRNKEKGWRRSYCISIVGDKDIYNSWNGSDDFFAMFLGDACLNAACYDHCKFKYDHSYADIRIGDLWSPKFKKETKGVCSAIAFSQIGEIALRDSDIQLVELPFTEVADGQMKSAVQRPWYYRRAMRNLRSGDRLHDIAKIVLKWKNINGHINRLKQVLGI